MVDGRRTRAEPRRALLVAPQPFFSERGTPIAVRYVLEALSQLRWQVDLLTLPLGDPVTIAGVSIHRLSNPLGIRRVPVGLSAAKIAFDLQLVPALARRLRSVRYDVVHAVEEAAIVAAVMLRRHRVPLLYDMASSLAESLEAHKVLRAAPFSGTARAIERWLLRRAGFVVCSPGLLARVRAAAPRTPAREWRFPAYTRPVSAEDVAALRAELGAGPDHALVVYAGNFAPYQGVDLLLDAASRVLASHGDSLFVLVGAADPGSIGALLERVPDPVRQRVRVLPRQPRERMPVFAAAATVLLSPRIAGSNFPLKLFDYLAAGRPIVATDIPAHRAVLDPSCAKLVPPTAVGLAAGISDLLTDPVEAARLASAGRRFAERELSWSAFVALIEEIYAGALAARSGADASFGAAA